MTTEVRVPDIGDFKDVPVIEIHVQPGDVVKAEDALITLESDKAAMDVPATMAGEGQKLLIKVGDKVSAGSPILELLTQAQSGTAGQQETVKAAATDRPAPAPAPAAPAAAPAPAAAVTRPTATPAAAEPAAAAGAAVYAGPAVRKLARELGVDLTQVHERNRGDREDPRRTANRYIKQIRYGNRVPLLDNEGRRPRSLSDEEISDAGWIFEV